MSYTVYAIVNPINGRPFYIGETKQFERRKQQHIKGTDQISGLIVRQIKANGFVPLFVVLETHSDEETALRAEIFWIETFLARGVDLVNSQAFSGWTERRAKRGVETRKAMRMEKMRKVANGRTAKRTNLSPQAGAKAQLSAIDTAQYEDDDWSERDVKRLQGMVAHGKPIPAMARMLGRSVRDIQARLKRNRAA